MFNFYEAFQTLYTKNKITEPPKDLGLCIALTRSLSKDPKNLPVLAEISKYLYYIKPEHYFQLMYYKIRKLPYVPKFYKTEKKEKVVLNKLEEKVKKIFGWSNKEYNYNKDFIELINKDKKTWKEELGE